MGSTDWSFTIKYEVNLNDVTKVSRFLSLFGLSSRLIFFFLVVGGSNKNDNKRTKKRERVKGVRKPTSNSGREEVNKCKT